MSLDFSIAPFFDDYDANQNFYKILFKPGRPVQTRELNQLQTILQEQISRFGSHLFKNGAMIIPGHVYYDNKVRYVKLAAINDDGIAADALLTSSIIGKTIIGSTGISATIISYATSVGSDPTTLFVKYTSGSTSGVTRFTQAQILNILDEDESTIIGTVKVATTSDNSSEGNAAICSISDGIYFVNRLFVNVEPQTIVVSKYTNLPTTRIGLNVVESIVTEKEDVSLYDNVLGYPDYGAPGSARHKVELILETRTIGTSDDESANIEKFIDLLQIEDGVIVYEINYTEYGEIMKMLAKRTYDESGDYEIDPFTVTTKNYRSNNRGSWTAETAYLVGDVIKLDSGAYVEALTSGVSGVTEFDYDDLTSYKYNDGSVTWGLINTPIYNGGVSTEQSDSVSLETTKSEKFIYEISRGTAYVKGFEIQKFSPSVVVADKGVEYQRIEDDVIVNLAGSFVEIANLHGLPEVGACEKVDIHFLNIADQGNYSGTLKRTATADITTDAGVITSINITDNGFGYDPATIATFAPSGGSGAVFRVVIDASSQVKEIKIINGGTGYSNGSHSVSAPPSAPLKIGTCRIRNVSYQYDNPLGAFGTSTASYRAEVFDIQLKDGFTWELHARSFVKTDGGVDIFKADIVTSEIELIGIATLTDNTKTVNGIGSSFIDGVKPGQSFRIRDGVENKTSFVSGSTIADTQFKSTHNIDTAANITNGRVYAVYNSFVTSGNLIQPLPKPFVRNIRSNDDLISAMTYAVKRKISLTSGGGGIWSVSLTVPGETFSSVNPYDFIVSVKKTGEPFWRIYQPTADYTLTLSGLNKTVTVNITNDAGNVTQVTTLCTVKKQGTVAREKIKVPTYANIDIRSVAELNKLQHSLGKTDVYKLIRVLKNHGPGTVNSGNYAVFGTESAAEDITDNFQLDNGQTAFYYGISSVKNTATKAPDNTIRIIFAYYKHSSGDYFSVDSYKSVPYENLSPLIRDGLDFRPSVDSNGDFVPSAGADLTEPIAFRESIVCDYSTYLPRRDVVYLTYSDNSFKYEKGTSSYSMPAVKTREDSMAIVDAIISPAPVSPSLYQLKKIPHKRYTMHDIGKLEQRLEGVEYYVQLSLLEKQTIDMRVVDENGLDRYKLGIMVDQFQDYSVADTSDPEYIAAIDPENKELRPMFLQEQMDLVELLDNDAARKAANYKLDSKGRITLDYENVVAISQPIATRKENINPHNVVSHNGNMVLVPNTDTWHADTNRHSTHFHLLPITGLFVPWNTYTKNPIWNEWNHSWLGNVRSNQFGEVPLQTKNMTTGEIRDYYKSIPVGSALDWKNVYKPVEVMVNGEPKSFSAYMPDPVKGDPATPWRQAWWDMVGSKHATTAYNIRPKPTMMMVTNLSPSINLDFYLNINKISSSAVTPSVVVDITSTVGTIYTYEDNWTVTNPEDSRRVNLLDSYHILNHGSLLISGSGRFIVAKKITLSNGNIRLYCIPTTMNITVGSATIQNGGSSHTVSIVSYQTNGHKTDSFGTFVGLLIFPYDSRDKSTQYQTGSIDVRVCKAADSFDSSASKASAKFIASGSINIHEQHHHHTILGQVAHAVGTIIKSVTSSVIPDALSIVNDNATSNQTISDYTSLPTAPDGARVVSAGRPVSNKSAIDKNNEATAAAIESVQQTSVNHEPVAQTFFVPASLYPSGIYCSGVSLWFSEKDTTTPVRVEIRPVVDNYPDTTLIVAGRDLIPNEITASESFSLSKKTTVLFDTLAYLEPGKEYAVIVRSNSKKYNLWIARQGEQKIGFDTVLKEQPDTTKIGNLFKSQNGATWEPSQYEDLTFEILKAKFNTSNAAKITFVNNAIKDVLLAPQSMIAVNGSSTVRVSQANHGNVVGDLVRIKFDAGTGLFANLSGVNTKTFAVTWCDIDSFDITMTDVDNDVVTATATGPTGLLVPFGGTDIRASKQHLYSSLTPSVDIAKLDGVDYGMTIRTRNSSKLLGEEFRVSNKETIQFTEMQQIVNSLQVDEFNTPIGNSVYLNLILTSNNEDISPVYDKERVSIIMVRNVVNDPVPDFSLAGDFHSLELPTVVANFDYNDENPELSYIEILQSEQGNWTDAVNAFDAIKIGMCVKVLSGSNANKILSVVDKTLTDTTYRVYVVVDPAFNSGSSTFNDAVGVSTGFIAYVHFIAEYATEKTSVIATHITTPMTLQNSGTGIQVLADMNVPIDTMVDIYYRTSAINEFRDFNTLPWLKMDAYPKVTPIKSTSKFVEEKYSKTNINEFNRAQIKLVMRSSNPAYVPRIKNLRMMALA